MAIVGTPSTPTPSIHTLLTPINALAGNTCIVPISIMERDPNTSDNTYTTGHRWFNSVTNSMFEFFVNTIDVNGDLVAKWVIVPEFAPNTPVFVASIVLNDGTTGQQTIVPINHVFSFKDGRNIKLTAPTDTGSNIMTVDSTADIVDLKVYDETDTPTDITYEANRQYINFKASGGAKWIPDINTGTLTLDTSDIVTPSLDAVVKQVEASDGNSAKPITSLLKILGDESAGLTTTAIPSTDPNYPLLQNQFTITVNALRYIPLKFDSSQTYEQGQMVLHNGVPYICSNRFVGGGTIYITPPIEFFYNMSIYFGGLTAEDNRIPTLNALGRARIVGDGVYTQTSIDSFGNIEISLKASPIDYVYSNTGLITSCSIAIDGAGNITVGAGTGQIQNNALDGNPPKIISWSQLNTQVTLEGKYYVYIDQYSQMLLRTNFIWSDFRENIFIGIVNYALSGSSSRYQGIRATDSSTLVDLILALGIIKTSESFKVSNPSTNPQTISITDGRLMYISYNADNPLNPNTKAFSSRTAPSIQYTYWNGTAWANYSTPSPFTKLDVYNSNGTVVSLPTDDSYSYSLIYAVVTGNNYSVVFQMGEYADIDISKVVYYATSSSRRYSNVTTALNQDIVLLAMYTFKKNDVQSIAISNTGQLGDLNLSATGGALPSPIQSAYSTNKTGTITNLNSLIGYVAGQYTIQLTGGTGVIQGYPFTWSSQIIDMTPFINGQGGYDMWLLYFDGNTSQLVLEAVSSNLDMNDILDSKIVLASFWSSNSGLHYFGLGQIERNDMSNTVKLLGSSVRSLNVSSNISFVQSLPNSPLSANISPNLNILHFYLSGARTGSSFQQVNVVPRYTYNTLNTQRIELREVVTLPNDTNYRYSILCVITDKFTTGATDQFSLIEIFWNLSTIGGDANPTDAFNRLFENMDSWMKTLLGVTVIGYARYLGDVMTNYQMSDRFGNATKTKIKSGNTGYTEDL